MSEDLWTERDTTAARIEAALRELLTARNADRGVGAVAPARVLNLVVIVDGEYRGEIENRLERIDRFHPSRTILCAVEGDRRTMDAWANLTFDDTPQRSGHVAVVRERVEIELGLRHLESLGTIVGPLLVSDLATLVWAPHGHLDGLRRLRRLAQIALIDSLDEPELDVALERAAELAGDMYVVDLAWLRSTPWRERIAAVFDPPDWRRRLQQIDTVTVRHRHDSVASAALLCGWLAARLDWRVHRLSDAPGGAAGSARARRGDVALRLEHVEQPGAPGLAGVTVGLASGESVSLDRGTGGLREARRARDGTERVWTVLGASRGEAGILGEGVRQALLRDPAYRPALACARGMVER